MSNLARYIKELIEELHKFRHEEKFQEVGFGRASEYYTWMVKLRTLKIKHATPKELRKLELTINDVEQYALQHVSNNIQPYLEHKINLFLIS